MAQTILADWTPDDFHTVEKGVLLARHRLEETGLFDDDHLAKIIDSHPVPSGRIAHHRSHGPKQPRI